MHKPSLVIGAAFSLAFVVTCGVPAVDGETPDAGSERPSDAGTICDCPPAPVPIPPVGRSGSRVKAEVMRSADGAQVFTGWFDTLKSSPCVLQTVASGVTYCVPPDRFIAGVGTVGYFADADCVVRIVPSPANAPLWSYVAETIEGGRLTTTVFARGPLHEGPAFRSQGNDDCESWSPGSNQFYRLGAEHPLSGWAEFESARAD